MNEIVWPAAYLPGETDNFVSNEMIIPGLNIHKVWSQLNTPYFWPEYYGNASDIIIYDTSERALKLGTRFRFTTFGFLVEAEVVEHIPPMSGSPARIAWHGWVEGSSDERLDVHHAWLFEELPGNKLRLLTQETQIGKPAIELAETRPNPMLNAHQAWLDGLIASAQSTS